MLILKGSRRALGSCALILLVWGLLVGLSGCSSSDASPQPAGGSATSPGSDWSSASNTGGTAEPSTQIPNAPDTHQLLMYAGAASKPPTEEIIELFKQKTGIEVEAVFGGSGAVLSQMKLAKQGDLYFPGSSDFMEKAKKEGDVLPETEVKVVYLVPAINVQRGNPKHVKDLTDLARDDITVAIANPQTVCVGLYAVEIVEKNMTAEQKAAFRANLLNYTESCEKTATAVALKQVDAVLGWSVFEHWNPQAIETVPLPSSQIPRVGYIPIAISSYSEHRAAAQQFIDFLMSSEGQAVFRKYGYFSTPEEAFGYVGEEKPVGGEYTLPQDWVTE